MLKLHEKGDKRRVIGLHFNAAQAIGEYVEKAGIMSGPLFRAQAASRSHENCLTARWTRPRCTA